MIVAQCLQRDLHLLAHLFERRQLLTYLARFPVDLVERFDVRRNNIGALGLLEGMATQHLLAHGGRMFRVLLKQINQSMSIGTVQSIGILVARHCDLFHILTQFNPRLPIDLDQLVDTTQGRLSLTGNCIGILNLLVKVSLYKDSTGNSPRCVPIPKQSIL